MKETPKLFIKNAKGRYEPYAIPTDDTQHTLYVKRGGKYLPWGRELSMDAWSEGVWVVIRHRSSKEFIQGKHLRECFTFDKASNLTDIPLSGLGTMEQYCARVLHDLGENDNLHCMTPRDLVQEIVGLIFNYDEELKKRKQCVEISFEMKGSDAVARSYERCKRQMKQRDNGK